MRLLFALLILIATVSIITDTRAHAGEWQEKPVMCGPEEEIFPLLRDKDERLVFAGKLFGKVRDPDEANGLSPTPAVLPFALYANFKTKSFTVLEYHAAPYYQYCVIAYGTELNLAEWGDPT
tara:strand:+ start:254 stop:619 length:366 start_codon:yes stop_codon:yes gene_type:complete